MPVAGTEMNYQLGETAMSRSLPISTLLGLLVSPLLSWILVTALLCGCSMEASTLYPPKISAPTKKVYLINHGWHAGIATQQNHIPKSIWPKLTGFRNLDYLEIGWGDRDYYTSTDPGLAKAVKAVLLPTSSVLHLAGFDGLPELFFPSQEIIEIELSVPGFENMIRFIVDSFARDTAGHVIVLGAGLYGNSRFYASKQTYYLCKTCNIWTANALQAAGCPIGSPITVEGLMSQAGTFGKVRQAGAKMP